MNSEVFAKVVKLSFENQRSQWELFVSNIGSNCDHALCSDQRGACVERKMCESQMDCHKKD